MKAVLLLLLTLLGAGLYTFNYTTQGPLNFDMYNLVNASNNLVLSRNQKQYKDYGEETTLLAFSNSLTYQQTFIPMAKGGDDDVYRLIMAGDAGEAMALCAYDELDEVFVKKSLNEDKLNKWWKFIKSGDYYIIQNTADLSNTYLCGNQVQSHSRDKSCKWSVEAASL
ncbi:hypothetical protein PPERSA_03778 [Pseudocohnilembus persalinus]|uniref:Ricin B lectin domain-containing protein n=1 Tax=Pseudocohnilembus persalinus TaxID=266149 RepID=A0A0V0R8L1_PSEPJ|nr:hypothetical protein PPERSA_03778 [Pseudocohnilembus persalinus]|eukprot:KRX10720.1 hypothetical protein PPERSA_03778 [Pseudocohnilembus persalinus]